jgi:hypothetical protein
VGRAAEGGRWWHCGGHRRDTPAQDGAAGGGADLMVGDLTTFVSTVRDEAFYVEVNLSDEDPSGSLDLGFESPPLEIA